VSNITQATNPLTILSTGNVGIGTTSPGTILSVAGASGILSEGPLTVWNGSTQRDAKVINGAICSDNNGSVKCQASLTAGTVYGDASSFAASDVAENYPLADTTIEEGDIVMAASSLSSDEQNKRANDRIRLEHDTPENPPAILESLVGSVARADAAHAAQVLGIVSTKPGVLLGDTTGFKLGSTFKPVALVGRVPVKVSTEGGSIRAGDRIVISSLPGIGSKATTSGMTVGIALEAFDGSAATTTASANGREVKTGKILIFVNLGYTQVDSALAGIARGDGSASTNAWSVDQSSGRVNVAFFGDINMQGNSILDVKKITGYLGKWSMDEDGTLMAVRVVTDEVITKKLTVGSTAAPSGITLYDEITKDPYCLKMRNGAMVSETGICGGVSADADPAASEPPPDTTGTTGSGGDTPTPAADAASGAESDAGSTADVTGADAPATEAPAADDTPAPAAEPTPSAGETATSTPL
jgi:hypothetical protein